MLLATIAPFVESVSSLLGPCCNFVVGDEIQNTQADATPYTKRHNLLSTG
jgi:hypothetical protein